MKKWVFIAITSDVSCNSEPTLVEASFAYIVNSGEILSEASAVHITTKQLKL